MLAIRMRRLGSKKRPFYRVVVIDSHSARDGRALEVLGHYNPTTVPETFTLDRDRLGHWVTRGAQPSDTVRTLLTRHPPGTEVPVPAPRGTVTIAKREPTPEPTPAPEVATEPASEAIPEPSIEPTAESTPGPTTETTLGESSPPALAEPADATGEAPPSEEPKES